MLPDRFWKKVDKTSTCWVWMATLADGYGRFSYHGRMQLAHVLSYIDHTGKCIPSGFEIDHLCCNPKCVRPDHLEVVSRKENILRGDSPASQNAQKVVCKNGHPLTDENVYLEKGKKRKCKTCLRNNGQALRVSCHQVPKQNKPSREILEVDLKESTWVGVGRKYGVSDNAVRKWAKSYNLIKIR